MFRRLLSLTAFVLLAALWAAPESQGLELVYPADGTYVTRSNFLIIKGGDSPSLDGISIALGEVESDIIDISSAEYKQAFADFLILQPEFDPGENRIRLTGYADGKKAAMSEASIFFLNDPMGRPPKGYRPFVMHTAHNEALCAPCHNMQPDRTELQVADERYNPCASCHRRMLNKTYVHGPAGVYGCASCHDAEVTEGTKYRLTANEPDLCNECHLEILKESQTNQFVHGPVGAGLCSICHDSHASEHVAQLRQPINELCLGCHDSIRGEPHVVRGVGRNAHPLKEVPDPSRPGRELSCTSCHNPHGGKVSALFRDGYTSRFALCQMCHQK